MNMYWVFLSVLPLSVFCLLLLFKKISLLKVSLITLLITLILVLFFWQMSPLFVFQLSLKGFLVAFDIFLIIFGAILFLNILKKGNVLSSLTFFLEKISPDFRIQIIILAWFFENFLEGIAGFGTPSTVVAPILVALGLSPMTSAVVALLGNSTASPFGAVGTPIKVGFAGINVNLISISTTTALINFIGILVPVFMLYFLVFKKPNKKQLFFEALPFAIWAGIAFVVPSFLVSIFGFEFPSIIGSIIGLILVLITNHFKIFVPKNVIKADIPSTSEKSLSLFKTISPYFLFILLLVFGKILLSNLYLPINFINYKLNLFNPGFIFIITSFIVILFLSTTKKQFFDSTENAFKKSIEPFFVIALISAVVQLMNNSHINPLNLASITQTIALVFSVSILPFLAPFIGAFGSLITGSATISAMMFGSSLYSSSISLGLNPVIVLSLSMAGAGAGNMIAIADVFTAMTVVGITQDIRKVISKLLPFCLIYVSLIGILGLMLTR